MSLKVLAIKGAVFGFLVAKEKTFSSNSLKLFHSYLEVNPALLELAVGSPMRFLGLGPPTTRGAPEGIAVPCLT